LRRYFPELEEHYAAIKKGRLATPLELDAVEKITDVLRASPTVIDVSLFQIIEEVAEPVPEPEATSTKDVPALKPGQKHPAPPIDPEPNVSPVKTRGFIFATIVNEIWKKLLDGPKVVKAIEAWHKVYELIKPHIEPILIWLRDYWLGGPGGTPPMRPIISA
jgi:hypothetical protein